MAARTRYTHDLAALERQVYDLGTDVAQAIHHAVWALQHRAVAFAQEVIAHDTEIDDQRYAIEQAALSLMARQQPMAGDLRMVSALTGMASELERIGDYAEGIAEIVIRCAAIPVLELPAPLESMVAQALAMLQRALDALLHRDPDRAAELEQADSLVDTLYREIVHWSLAIMRTQPDHAESALYYVWVAHNVERIADRTVNIAERAAFVATGVVVRPPA